MDKTPKDLQREFRRIEEEKRTRQRLVDHDIARYGESYARITLGDDGGLKMEHVPRNLVRPILAITPGKPS